MKPQDSCAIVITTINHPTRAVRHIAEKRSSWRLIVVGDKKTPADWACDGAEFISFSEQMAMDSRFAESCPPNHYSRKNIGYLAAIQAGAIIIAETDDDNIPYDSFIQNIKRHVRMPVVATQGWVNIYTHFTSERIWPRGFPLELINKSLKEELILTQERLLDCPVQQFLADGDPDVDAIYRLTAEGEIKFGPGDVAIGPGSFCPFNSQNTIWWKDAFPLLYLPTHVSFRMTDIWRSFVAQICLFQMSAHVAFRGPTVFQERNEHSLIRDFREEIPGYLENARIKQLLEELDLEEGAASATSNLVRCYKALVLADIVPPQELELLDAWLADLEIAASALEAV